MIPAGPGQAEQAVAHQPTVFLVEDDEPTRYSMTALLTREGYLVLTAATVRDAMGVLRQPLSAIDVTVLDVHLPDASGIDICERLRERWPRVAVIVCSGEASPEEAAQLLRLGAHRYLQKPVSVDELLATVAAALP
jgi:DNA-binding response OmpR family regulator